MAQAPLTPPPRPPARPVPWPPLVDEAIPSVIPAVIPAAIPTVIPTVMPAPYRDRAGPAHDAVFHSYLAALRSRLDCRDPTAAGLCPP